MPAAPAEHVVVSEATDRGRLAAHARNIRLRSLIVQIAVTAVLGAVAFVRLESTTQFVILVAVIAVLGAVSMVTRRMSRDEAAKASRWAKVFPVVSIEQADERRAHAFASLLVTDDGVVVRRRSSSRFAPATYTTIVEVPWSAIAQVAYSTGRFGSWYPVISGPEIEIAAAGTVGVAFLNAMQALGASVS